MKPERQIAEWLHLDPADLAPVARAEALPGVDQGGITLPLVLASLHLWIPADLGPVDTPVYRSDRAPTVVRVPSHDLVRVHRGTPVDDPTPGLASFDTRGEPTLLEVRGSGGHTWLLDARDGAIAAWDPSPLVSDSTLLGSCPEVVAPPVEAWMQACGAEDWLAADVTALAASPRQVDRAAAVGLLSRLWIPPDQGDVPPASRPSVRARAWAGSLLPEQVATLERHAVEQVAALVDRLATLPLLPPDLQSAEVASFVLERDDLQAVRRVLRLANAGDLLGPALEALDGQAQDQASLLANLLPPVDVDAHADRWHAVAWQEPEAWWAGLA